MIKRVLVLFAFLVIIVSGLIFKNDVLAASRYISNYSSCNSPIKYKIGVIDERFGISANELKKDLIDSTNVWSSAIGKDLFIEDPSANLTINLIYDKRQELNSKINELDTNLQQKRSELDPKMEEYKRRSDEFSKKIAAFNEEVQMWNNKGGATKEVYDRLIKEQENLKQEASQLDALANELGQSTDQYNQDVTNLNLTINNFDLAIQGRPEEGLYERNGKEETITIFLHNSKKEFIHTLTHEFGHALGLNHVKNSDAIMFAKTNEVIVPSNEDLSQLSEICRERFIGEVIVERYKEIFRVISERLAIRMSN